MVERGTGRIIIISSLIGQTGNIGQANYAASKSGLFGLTSSLAREAEFQLQQAGKFEDNPMGITVNCVTPGYVATEMLEHHPREGAGPDQGPDPGRPAGRARRDRPRRALPGRRRLRLHHRAGVGRQRRIAHVTQHDTSTVLAELANPLLTS